MPPLLTLSYWFAFYPPPLMPVVERIMLIVFCALFIAGIVVWVMRLRGGYSKPVKRALSRLATHLGWTGIVGLGLWFVSYERVPGLSMRIGLLAWVAWFVVGAWLIGRYIWKDIPALEERQKAQAEERKWLPKRKK